MVVFHLYVYFFKVVYVSGCNSGTYVLLLGYALDIFKHSLVHLDVIVLSTL